VILSDRKRIFTDPTAWLRVSPIMTTEISRAGTLITVGTLRKCAVTARGQVGYIFHSDGSDAALSFVPADCVYLTLDGQVGVNEMAYFASGWGIRNRRYSESETGGKFVFPDADRIVTDLEHPAVRLFLRRVS